MGTGFKYICESIWHEEVELKKFETCPTCNSEAYHKVQFFPVEDEVEETNEETKEE